MSVRLQYIIPGWEPAPITSAPNEVETIGSSPWNYGAQASTFAPSWRDVLGLNAPLPGELALEPPPLPSSLSYSDADTDRRLWNGFIQRHKDELPSNPIEGRLLAALARMREQDEALTGLTMMEIGD